MAGLAQIALPQMSTANYASNTYDGRGQAMGYVGTSTTTGLIGNQNGLLAFNNNPQQFGMQRAFDPHDDQLFDRAVRAMQEKRKGEVKVADKKEAGRRIVKVIIVDPDEKVPLEKCVLYSGEEKLTDLTDNELFFEIDIKNILEKHNATRIAIVDKAVKDRVEHLEPVKVRDLRMVVVTVASF